MNPLIEAGLEIQHFIQSKGWRFCFIGGLAVIRWGEVRMTQDIDLCVLIEVAQYIKIDINRYPDFRRSRSHSVTPEKSAASESDVYNWYYKKMPGKRISGIASFLSGRV